MDRQRSVVAIALLATLCGVLLATRIIRSGTLTYAFLVWNLVLALVPVLAAVMLTRTGKRSTSINISFGVLWLAFLPNAPYVVTDLLHLRLRPPVPLWYDVVLLMAFAITGLVAGFVSVALVQHRVLFRFGRPASWGLAAFALALCGFGIYLGRFVRANSWEIVTDPAWLFGEVMERAMNPSLHPRTMAVTLIYGGALLAGYSAFRLLFAVTEADILAAPPNNPKKLARRRKVARG